MTSFGTAIRKAREQAGLSQNDLATATGLHRTHISLLERGRRHPQLETLVKLSRALDVTPAQMLSWYANPQDGATAPVQRAQ